MSTFYITTPIYYVNDVPHLGHAYTTIVCDALARFHRMRGDDTRFLTGTDEHGQKVEEAATRRGLTPRELVDQVAPRFDDCWRALGLSGYRFIRTTSARHQRVVRALWERIRRAHPDDLYLETYQGWYCVGCEAFYTESQLAREGDAWLCATHKRPVSWIDKERSWFFRLSRFAAPLLAHIEASPDFIQPEAYRREVVAFLQGGLRDLSVSRTSFAWGIPVPESDPEGKQHVIYVWMDALTNYLADLCPDDESGDPFAGPDVARYWPHATHVIGKDILRFHSVYWPAFLLAAGLPLPRSIVAHGWWTVRGEKISKSMPATRIDPLALADALGAGSPLGRAIGVDAMRYYLLREVPLGHDGDFTFESLFGRFNAELANDLGNLVTRSLTLIRKLGGAAPAVRHDDDLAGPAGELEEAARRHVGAAADHFEQFAPSRALEELWALVRLANRFIDLTKPWEMAKADASSPALSHTLWTLGAAVWLLARVTAPVLPTFSRTVLGWLGEVEGAAGPRWPVPIADERGRARILLGAPSLQGLAAPTPLFPRLDDAAQARALVAVVGDAAAATAPPAGAPTALPAAAPPAAAAPAAPGLPAIAMDDFARVELRAGRVVSAAAVPKAKKLLHLAVDLGEGEPRSIVAGIAERYAPDELVGKQVIVVANLAPATIRGIRSEGMILAAGDAAIVGLSALDRDVAPGTRVR
jgi:methionyl-tRNA synthetase